MQSGTGLDSFGKQAGQEQVRGIHAHGPSQRDQPGMWSSTFQVQCEVASNVESALQGPANRGFPEFSAPHLYVASEGPPSGGLIHFGRGIDATFSISQGSLQVLV